MENLVETIEDTLRGKYLTFEVDSEMYGIEIRYVTEIIGIEAITEMPEMPDFIKGIINLRGRIIPVMDVRLRFRKPPCDYNDRTCIVVIRFGSVSIGLIVDSVSEVITIPDTDIVRMAKEESGIDNRYIKNIGRIEAQVVMLIDCESLLTVEGFIDPAQIIA